MSFNTIPVLDLDLARDATTKPQFLQDLRKTLIEVGFLYISNTGLPDDLIQKVIENAQAFFKLPTEAKLKCQMKNRPSFLGSFPPSLRSSITLLVDLLMRTFLLP